MGHAMDSSEIHPEDAGDHFFDLRVAQQLAKAKEISGDSSFDEADDDDSDFDEGGVPKRRITAGYFADSEGDAVDFIQSQADAQLEEEGERAVEPGPEDADHVGMGDASVPGRVSREPCSVKPGARAVPSGTTRSSPPSRSCTARGTSARAWTRASASLRDGRTGRTAGCALPAVDDCGVRGPGTHIGYLG